MTKKSTATSKPDLKLFGDLCKSLDLKALYELRGVVTNHIQGRTRCREHLPPGATRKDFTSPKYAYSYLMNEDWSGLFSDREDGTFDNYVYIHVDPRQSSSVLHFNYDGASIRLQIPFYVGSGREKRAYNFKRCRQHTKKLREIVDAGYGRHEIAIIICSEMSKAEALELESKLILFWGCLISSSKNRCAMWGGQPVLLNQQYEPYPDGYNSLHMCHATT
jgi:hypothetical protein